MYVPEDVLAQGKAEMQTVLVGFLVIAIKRQTTEVCRYVSRQVFSPYLLLDNLLPRHRAEIAMHKTMPVKVVFVMPPQMPVFQPARQIKTAPPAASVGHNGIL